MTALQQERSYPRHSTFVFERCEALISTFTVKFVLFPKKTYILHIYMICAKLNDWYEIRLLRKLSMTRFGDQLLISIMEY